MFRSHVFNNEFGTCLSHINDLRLTNNSIEDAYGDTPPPPVSGFLTTAVTVDMEGVELSVKRKSLCD